MSGGPLPASAQASCTPSLVRTKRIRCRVWGICPDPVHRFYRLRDCAPMAAGPSSPDLACMIKRIGFFAYGVVCYAIFFATFLYAVGFIGGFAVPTTLDGAAHGPLARGIAVDAGLLALFAIQHSIMARRWFKERWTRFVPP